MNNNIITNKLIRLLPLPILLLLGIYGMRACGSLTELNVESVTGYFSPQNDIPSRLYFRIVDSNIGIHTFTSVEVPTSEDNPRELVTSPRDKTATVVFSYAKNGVLGLYATSPFHNNVIDITNGRPALVTGTGSISFDNKRNVYYLSEENGLTHIVKFNLESEIETIVASHALDVGERIQLPFFGESEAGWYGVYRDNSLELRNLYNNEFSLVPQDSSEIASSPIVLHEDEILFFNNSKIVQLDMETGELIHRVISSGENPLHFLSGQNVSVEFELRFDGEKATIYDVGNDFTGPVIIDVPMSEYLSTISSSEILQFGSVAEQTPNHTITDLHFE